MRLLLLVILTLSYYPNRILANNAKISYQDIVISRGNYVSFPDIVKLNSGELLVIYRQGKNHTDIDGKIWAIKSDTYGNFINPPFVLYDDPTVDDRDPSIYQLSNGDIVLTFFKYFYSPIKSTQTFFVKFNSNLEKLEERRVSIDSLKMATSSNLIESSKLGLILPVYGYKNSEKLFSIGFYQSLDLGLDWSPFNSIISGIDFKNWPQEPSILELNSHKFLIIYRTSDEKSGPAGIAPMYFTISKNDTLNEWEAPTKMDTIGHAPKLINISDEKVLVIFRSLDNFMNNNLNRCEVAFKISKDQGRTWSKNQVIYSTPDDINYGWDCGYPSITKLNDHEFLAVYYTFRGKSIQTARFNISD